MISYELSNYQKSILANVIQNNDNLLVNAKAGSGKTSTLLLVSEAIQRKNKKCLFLAFNKSIVSEIGRKITNPDCMVKTIHSVRTVLFTKLPL